MTTYIYDPVTIPGAELERRFGALPLRIGSENYTGLQSKAVDALVHVRCRNTLDDLETATRGSTAC